MKKTFSTFASLALAAALALPAASAAPVFEVDGAHSYVTFKVRHLISNVKGSFNDFTGTIEGDPGDPAKAKVSFVIQAASIDTANADRDAHLRNEDFFDVDKHPEITFVSSKIVSAGENLYHVHGIFTMRGVSKEIVLPVTFNGVAKDPWGNERAGFEVTMTLNRKDYGINWNKALDQGGMILGDEVEISIALEAVRQKPAEKTS